MPQVKMNVSDFSDSVTPLLEFLRRKFPQGLGISDIVDNPDITEQVLKDKGVADTAPRRYVDLVLEGGGVHGIALAGYTYILEKMGNSFMSTAGTSAGAINSMLLHCVYTKREAVILDQDPAKYYETRSEKLLEYLSNKDLSELVDGHRWWRSLILNAFTGKVRFSNLKKYFKKFRFYAVLFVVNLLLLLLFMAGNTFLEGTQCLSHTISRWGAIVSGILLFAAICFITAQLLRGRMLYLFAERLGINPGDDFEGWVSRCMADNGIQSVTDLKNKLDKEGKRLHYRYDKCSKAGPDYAAQEDQPLTRSTAVSDTLQDKIEDPRYSISAVKEELKNRVEGTVRLRSAAPAPEKASAPEPMQAVLRSLERRVENFYHEQPVKQLVIVAADITNETKVEFPAMHPMYWGSDYSISPAQYVRASMSIPFFFKPLKVSFAASQLKLIQEEWYKRMGVRKQFTEENNYSLFVDGGLISNFPVNVFYNPEIPVPAKPTIGVKLEYEDDGVYKSIRSELGLVGSMVSTMRYFYDRDFINKHNIYRKTVRSIDTGNINWLNFNLSSREKIELFFRGALTATIFLSRHCMTGQEEQELLSYGKSVKGTEGVFSIYEGQEMVFHTEDFSLDNITFEWEQYKFDRMLADDFFKQNPTELLKKDAALVDPKIQKP
ncbi:patatin-like phospholipase family protein [Taibaiella helva]|uniref:patatin-like phospholipase family protein n=1 Tax=Taibaiella helva TaxID=2301235 RepID=UPI0013006803|nr:patatin-like phospholipase family protein [Taibaiella helva]